MPRRYAETIDYDRYPYAGMSDRDAAAAMGRPLSQARYYLFSRGYRLEDGVLRTIPTVHETEDAINARIAAAPPTFPCSYCGCRRCECRKAA